MIHKTFKVQINAPAEKVWECLWQDDNYKKWTSAFNTGSHAVTDWQEGSEIRFLNQYKHGVYGFIDKVERYRLMQFRHVGEVKDGINQPLTDKTKVWTNSIESYRLQPNDDGTLLEVAVDIPEEHEQSFDKSFPQAMDILKNMAEKEMAG